MKLEVLTAPSGCKKCDKAKKKIESVIKDYKDKIKVKETDVTEEPEKMVELGVMSTPAVLINGELEFEGVPEEEQLREKIEECI